MDNRFVSVGALSNIKLPVRLYLPLSLCFCKNILETQKCILFKMILALTVSFTSPKGPFGFALCER